jgi:hypothetical protein
MPIARSDIGCSSTGNSGHMAYNMWGSLIAGGGGGFAYSDLFPTRNDIAVTNLDASSMGGLTPSLTRTPTSLTFLTPGTLDVSVLSTGAWYASGISGTVFSIQTQASVVTLTSSSGTRYGGNGFIRIFRNSTSGEFSGTLTITYTNGAGGSTTTTVALTATGF